MQGEYETSWCAEIFSEEVILATFHAHISASSISPNSFNESLLLYHRYRKRLRQWFVQTHSLLYCPSPRCNHVFLVSEDFAYQPLTSLIVNASLVMTQSRGISALPILCYGCITSFCHECRLEYHFPLPCLTYRAFLKSDARADALRLLSRKQEINEVPGEELLIETKPCPNCKTKWNKNEGCNHMICTVCRTHFCWICLKLWGSEHMGSFYEKYVRLCEYFISRHLYHERMISRIQIFLKQSVQNLEEFANKKLKDTSMSILLEISFSMLEMHYFLRSVFALCYIISPKISFVWLRPISEWLDHFLNPNSIDSYDSLLLVNTLTTPKKILDLGSWVIRIFEVFYSNLSELGGTMSRIDSFLFAENRDNFFPNATSLQSFSVLVPHMIQLSKNVLYAIQVIVACFFEFESSSFYCKNEVGKDSASIRRNPRMRDILSSSSVCNYFSGAQQKVLGKTVIE
jgi:hypothetical protein